MSQTVRRLAVPVLTLLFTLFPGLVSPQNAPAANAVVLQYHHVSDATPRVTSLSAEEFRLHLEYLRDNGFSVVPLEDVVQALRTGASLPAKTAAITFDDGFRDNYDTAFPLLREFGWPFTLFVSAGLVGANDDTYLNWEQVREMADNGATIANHGSVHSYLLARAAGENEAAWLQRIEQEILVAEAEIERQTGQSHKLFAYPFGEYDRAIQDLVARIGFVGIGQQSGPVNARSDFTALPRFPLSGNYAAITESFAVKLHSLAFDVTLASPETPVTDAQLPEAVLDFNGAYRFDALNCFNNDARMQVTVENAEEQRYRVTPREPNTARRFRYNCTAPAGDGRYYWYSITWVNPALVDY